MTQQPRLRRAEALERAIARADELIALTRGLDSHAHTMAIRVKRILQAPTPMQDILDRVPGESVTDRAATAGVSRQTWYNWLNDRGRPDGAAAKRLAALTGVAEDIILGR